MLGFGKFNYQGRIFQELDVVLPTFAKGNISKVIDHDGKQTFFKTDAHVHSGFSGCGVWTNQKQVGTTIFILKNATNALKISNHNVSIASSFIW